MPQSFPRPRRRWCRLSLRGLLVLVLIVGGGSGWMMHRIKGRQRALALVRAAGGDVMFARECHEPTGVCERGMHWIWGHVDAWLGQEWLADASYVSLPGDARPEVIMGLNQFDHLDGLWLAASSGSTDLRGLAQSTLTDLNLSDCEDQTLRAIPMIQSLKTLQIDSQAVTDAGLAALAAFPELEELDITISARMTDAGLARALAGLPRLTRFKLSALRLRPYAITLAALARYHPTLTELKLPFVRADAADFAALGTLQHLEHLDLTGVEVADADLVQLGGLTRLARLTIEGTEVTDAGLAALAGLTRLRHLDLHCPWVTSAGLAHLAELDLVELDLGFTLLTDAGLAVVARMPWLERLGLRQTRVTDAGLKLIAHLPLVALDLNGTRVTDAGMATLARLSRLTSLDLEHTVIHDAGLVPLAGLTALADLDLTDTWATAAGVANLQQDLPTLRVVR